MTHFTVHAQTSRQSVCDELDKFQRFSAVDAKIEGNAVTLYEVGLGERLRRALTSLTGKRDQATEDSRSALQQLARVNPAIGKVLGQAIRDKSNWSASELKGQLKVAAQILEPGQTEGKVAVKLDRATAGVQLGLANAEVQQIEADARIQWLTPDAKPGHAYMTPIADAADPETGELPRIKTLSLSVNPHDLGGESLKERYRSAIERCGGHVVIEPIPDLQLQHPKDAAMKGKSSDQSIGALLDAIDDIMGKAPRALKAITIAGGRAPGLADQIWDCKAQRESAKAAAPTDAQAAPQAAPQAARRPGIHPHAGRPMPATPGLHFLKNHALELDAERIVVPAPVARSHGLEAASEKDLAPAPGAQGRQVIGMRDDVDAIPLQIASNQAQERYRKLLQGVDGRVVIQPLSFDVSTLEQMMEAARQACIDNPKLSVAFAVPDAKQRDLLATAWTKVRDAALENADLDELDADLQTVKWESA